MDEVNESRKMTIRMRGTGKVTELIEHIREQNDQGHIPDIVVPPGKIGFWKKIFEREGITAIVSQGHQETMFRKEVRKLFGELENMSLFDIAATIYKLREQTTSQQVYIDLLKRREVKYLKYYPDDLPIEEYKPVDGYYIDEKESSKNEQRTNESKE